MAHKQTVTLSKIAVFRGTAYGPGAITVPLEAAQYFITAHGAQAGAVVNVETADLLKLPFGDLTPEEQAQVLAHYRKEEPISSAPAIAPAPETAVTQVAPKEITEEEKTEAARWPGVVGQILSSCTEDQMRQQIIDRNQPMPEAGLERWELAKILAKAAGYKGVDEVQPLGEAEVFVLPDAPEETATPAVGGQQQGEQAPVDPAAGDPPKDKQLPVKFPARAKLMKLGFTTLPLLKASTAEQWTELSTEEVDAVNAELALQAAE